MELTSIALQGLNTTSSSAHYQLGDRYRDGENQYVYSQANSAINAGDVLTVDEDALSVTGVATGVSTTEYNGRPYGNLQYISKTSIAASAGLYEGYMGVVTEGLAKGEVFEIDKNSTSALYLKNPLTSSADGIKAFHPCIVIPTPAGQVVAPFGVAPVTVVSSYYFWRQVAGIALVNVADPTSSRQGHLLVVGVSPAGYARVAKAGRMVSDTSVVGSVILGSNASNAKCWAKLVPMG